MATIQLSLRRTAYSFGIAMRYCSSNNTCCK